MSTSKLRTSVINDETSHRLPVKWRSTSQVLNHEGQYSGAICLSPRCRQLINPFPRIPGVIHIIPSWAAPDSTSIFYCNHTCALHFGNTYTKSVANTNTTPSGIMHLLTPILLLAATAQAHYKFPRLILNSTPESADWLAVRKTKVTNSRDNGAVSDVNSPTCGASAAAHPERAWRPSRRAQRSVSSRRRASCTLALASSTWRACPTGPM